MRAITGGVIPVHVTVWDKFSIPQQFLFSHLDIVLVRVVNRQCVSATTIQCHVLVVNATSNVLRTVGITDAGHDVVLVESETVVDLCHQAALSYTTIFSWRRKCVMKYDSSSFGT